LGASDVVLKEDQKAIYRILGKLTESDQIVSRAELERFTSFLRPAGYVQEYLGGTSGMDVSFEYHGRYRVNCFSSMGKRCAAMRVISDEIRTLKNLGLPEDLSSRVIDRKGLSLIVGKTGAGKSTTLAAITQSILMNEKAHIITLEDPVEYRYSRMKGEITQREMGIDFPGFEVGIQDALRQSPDYIVIGEIRTLSALKAAISAAEAGHGIIGTIHSIGAARTLTRMLSMFSEAEKEFIRYQLSANLNFILSQKLTYNDRKAHLDYELMLNIPSMENTIREGRFNQMDNLILLGEKQGMKRFSAK
jgi:twitching motility protein PilT